MMDKEVSFTLKKKKKIIRGRRGRDRVVVGFTTTCEISV
jgi:hypothetical protein